jgi:hypothetical protein
MEEKSAETAKTDFPKCVSKISKGSVVCPKGRKNILY